MNWPVSAISQMYILCVAGSAEPVPEDDQHHMNAGHPGLLPTSSQPFSTRTTNHVMPRYSCNWIVKPKDGFELSLDNFRLGYRIPCSVHILVAVIHFSGIGSRRGGPV